jgi:hypothetical protein
VFALSELKKGNGQLAARLMAKAVEQPDLDAAIATLEASNKHAFALQAKKKTVAAATPTVSSKQRLRASDEFPFDETAEGNEEVAAEEGDMMDADPLEEVAADEVCDDTDPAEDETPGQAMAKVLSKMVRRSGRK